MLSRHIESQFSFLDELPDPLYHRVVTLRHGRLQQRVQGVMQWRKALLSGELPELGQVAWPERHVAQIILKRLRALELAAYCKEEESLVDHVLLDICSAVESVEQWQEKGLVDLFDDLLPSTKPTSMQRPTSGEPSSAVNKAEKHRIDIKPVSASGVSAVEAGVVPDAYDGGEDAVPLDNDSPILDIGAPDTTLPEVEGTGTHEMLDLEEKLQHQWRNLLAQWRETREIFQGMGMRLGRGWDLSRGILASEGWRELVRYRKLLKDHPAIVSMVDSLGRAQKNTTTESGSEEKYSEINQPPKDRSDFTKIHSKNPMFTHGITRSDDIARMLPQEAAFLGHARLHMLWHARRAEQALLSYQVEGVLSQHRPRPIEYDEKAGKKSRSVTESKGPFILCVDTSASMHGKPERLAKAVCLEVVRLANQQKRPCMLFAFSGPGQLLEISLDFTPAGLKSIIRFLQQSFYGGTDICEPIARALNRIGEKDWQKADLLLISDARFPVPDAVVDSVKGQTHSRGLRIQGIVIGHWKSTSMDKICQTVKRIETI